MSLWRRRPDRYVPDDDRSFAVALRLEMVAKRLAIVNQALEARLEEQDAERAEGSEQ